jgi:CHAT domain-containing protein/tetratricopeptide (TPR) repeat protein
VSARSRFPAWPLSLLLPIALLPVAHAVQSPRRPVVQTAAFPERQTFTIRLAAGEALHAAIHRDGVETTISLVDPAGRPVFSLDSPDWIAGREDLFAVVDRAGDYRLEVERSGRGRFHLTIDPPRLATAADRSRATAERELANGDRLRLAGHFGEASRAYQQSVADWERAGEPGQAAIASYRLANVLEEVSKADRALDIDRRLLAAWGRSLAGDAALNAIGRCYVKAGLREEARDTFQQAESQARNLGDPVGHAGALANLAQLDKEREHGLQAALDELDKAREELQAPGFREEATIRLDLGQIRYTLGAWDEAIDDALRALDIQRRAGDLGGQVVSQQLLGASYTGKKLWEPAARSFEQARTLAREQGRLDFELAAIAGLGYVDSEQGRLDQAARILEEGLRLPRRADVARAEAANVRANLGAVYSKQGKSAQALRCFDRAIAVYRRPERPADEAAALLGKAKALERAGRLAEALATVEVSIATTERLRTEVAGSDLRASFFARQQDEYELAVRVLMKLDEERPGRGFDRRAFEFAERMRARTLLDELGAASLDVHARAAPALLAQEQRIEGRLRAERKRNDAEATSASLGRLASIEAEIRSANSELEAVRGKMRQADRAYRAITRPRPLGLREIQRQVLDDETLLLAYSLGEEESFLWAVGRSSFHVHRLGGRQGIEDLADSAYRCFEARDGCTEQGLALASARLSAAILRPAAAELAGRRLLVVADGALQRIPFAALPDPAGPPGAPAFLDFGHEIVHLTSASLLPMLRRKGARPRAPKLVAALGDAVFERDDARLQGVVDRRANDRAEPAARDPGLVRLPRLAHTREEVEKIVSLVPPGLALEVTGFAANRALVMSPELGSYRFVHLATHALRDPLNPELTGIVLSRYDAQGHRQDGFLHAYEVYGLKLSADLVVLSACQTALGREVRGEGLIGLTRGFQYAGAPRVLVSLWNVNDRTTADLMQVLYQGMLRDGLRPAAALRRAQIEVARTHRSPYDWAAFELQGDWR